MPEITVTAIPAFADNYIWLISTDATDCAVVDPGDAQVVLDTLQDLSLNLAYILITHHHADHTGGVQRLVAETSATVLGPHDPRIRGIDQRLAEGDLAELPRLGLAFETLEVPGHTSSHIAFHGHGCLFCGDTLFSVGCGRLFEGSPEQMQSSLDKLASLPAQSQVFCAHEYTLSNCDFALQVEPENEQLKRRASEVEAARAIGRSTVPSTLGSELEINPFLRTRVDSVVQTAKNRNPDAQPGASTLAVIRAWKDNF